MWNFHAKASHMKVGAQIVSQTFLFLFHHSPHSPTSRLKARLKLFFVICIWWLSLAKGCHSDCCQSGEEKRDKTRGRKVLQRQRSCLEGRRSSEMSYVVNVRSRKVRRSNSERSLRRWQFDPEPAWGVTPQALQRCEKKVSDTWWSASSQWIQMKLNCAFKEGRFLPVSPD